MNTKIINTTPVTQMLKSLVNSDLPEKHISALNEFIDNSLGEGSGNAAKVEIHYKKDQIAILDNGQGIENIGSLFTIGEGQNRLHDSDIGNFGWGSKVGALYLGWKVEVHTVKDGVYENLSVDWKAVEKAGNWPTLKVTPKSAKSAPKAIRGGGTLICIKDRHPDRKWQTATLVTKISHTYSPALMNGKEIRLIHYSPDNKIEKEYSLSKNMVGLKLDNVIEFEGEVHGKKFKVKAGTSQSMNRVYNAVHIGFGHRIIKSEYSLPNHELPASVYVEVTLDSGWKTSLTVTKADIAVHKSALLNAVEDGIAPLLESISENQENFRLEHLTTSFEGALDEAMKVAAKGKKTILKLVKEKPKNPDIDIDPDKPETPKKPFEIKLNDDKKGKEVKVESADTSPSGFSINYSCLMGEKACQTHMHNGALVVTLNKELPYIANAIKEPFDILPLWGLATSSIVDLIFSDYDTDNKSANTKIVEGLHDKWTDAISAQEKKVLKEETLYALIKCAPTKIKEPTPTQLKQAIGE